MIWLLFHSHTLSFLLSVYLSIGPKKHFGQFCNTLLCQLIITSASFPLKFIKVGPFS